MSEKLEVGSIVEGKVVRVKPFGAIVSLGNTQGLVHISQVANSFVQDINEEYGEHAIFHINDGGFLVDELNCFRYILNIYIDTKLK